MGAPAEQADTATPALAARPGVVSCAHSAECAGCPLILFPYEEQLAKKRARVVECLGRYPSLELVYAAPVVPAEPAVAYRARAKLMVAPGPRLGLYAQGGGHVVVDIPDCLVLAPSLLEIARALRTLMLAPPEGTGAVLRPFEPDGSGALRAVDLREVADGGEPGVLVTLVLQTERAGVNADIMAAARAVHALSPKILGVAANFREGDSPQVLGAETSVLSGATQAKDRIGRTYHLATYGSFVQAHRGQAAAVRDLIAQEISTVLGDLRAKRVLDLYGGSGAIALSLAAEGAAVKLVESFQPAAHSAKRAAEEQGLGRLAVHCADAAVAARSFAAAGEAFDAVIVNPPRRGVSPEAREAVARLGAPLVVYVSCDPMTLARDLDHFTRLGYAAPRVHPFDMIPMTDEVETVAVLRRTAPPPPRLAYEDDEVLIVEKCAGEPSTPQGEHASSLLDRARRLPGAAGVVPVHRLDAGTSGLIILAKRPSVVEGWAKALAAENGRKIYLAAVKGVTPSKGAIARDLRDEDRLVTARTRYRRLAVVSGHCILRVIPDDARQHQIRRHLAGIGHPVLGDARYGHAPTNRYFEEKFGLDRTFLHCVRIEIDHPTSGKRLVVEAPLPGDLRAMLERLGGASTVRFLEQKNSLGGLGPSSSLPPEPRSSKGEG